VGYNRVLTLSSIPSPLPPLPPPLHLLHTHKHPTSAFQHGRRAAFTRRLGTPSRFSPSNHRRQRTTPCSRRWSWLSVRGERGRLLVVVFVMVGGCRARAVTLMGLVARSARPLQIEVCACVRLLIVVLVMALCPRLLSHSTAYAPFPIRR
jgi:hypothetical protein